MASLQMAPAAETSLSGCVTPPPEQLLLFLVGGMRQLEPEQLSGIGRGLVHEVLADILAGRCLYVLGDGLRAAQENCRPVRRSALDPTHAAAAPERPVRIRVHHLQEPPRRVD